MDITFYVILVVVCLVVLLAMWACAAADTRKWGPDLTLELPPHVLQQVLFGTPASTEKKTDFKILQSPIPSAPSELASDPLLSNEHPAGMSNPPSKYYRPPVLTNMDNAVQVLPTHFVPNHKLRPVFCFTTEEPA